MKQVNGRHHGTYPEIQAAPLNVIPEIAFSGLCRRF